MMNFRSYARKLAKKWLKSEKAFVAVEASFIFPILFTMLVGINDLGNGILASQKTIRSSQVLADLVTRDRTISMTDVEEAIMAAELALQPLPTGAELFGVDVVSVEFDMNSQPQIVWRETRNMTPVPDILDDLESLAEPNTGIIIAVSRYVYTPWAVGFVIDEIIMQEKAFARGRKSSVVDLEGEGQG